MDAIELIEQRRSVRSFTDQRVDRETMREIVNISRWAPSWANFQIARYTLIEDQQLIQRIANEGVNGFTYNLNTLRNATGVAVLSYVQGKSGKKPNKDGSDSYATGRDSDWEMFDAGIACQTFCLAAHAKGVGTCIMGIINDGIISEVAQIPEGESVAAIIVYGYEAGEHAPQNHRHEVDKILRFL